MNVQEKLAQVILAWKQGDISEEQFSKEITSLLNDPRTSWYFINNILHEIKEVSQDIFLFTLDYVFNNLHQVSKRVGQYPFSGIFRNINLFLLKELSSQDDNLLTPYVDHKNPCVRALVANCLVEWGDSGAFYIIEQALLQEKFASLDIAHLYERLVEAPLSEPQIQRLAKAIQQSENLTRATLLRVCAELKDARLVPILTDLLKDYQEPYHKWGSLDPICYQAAAILQEIDTPDAHEALSRWGEKEFQRLKREIRKGRCYNYAPKLGDPRLIPILAEAVQNNHDVDQELYAMYALAKFHHADTIDPLIDFISNWQSKKRKHQEHKIVPIPPYVASTQRGYRVLWEAIQALGKLKPESAVPVIADVLSWEHHPDELAQTQRIAYHALRLIGTFSAQDVIRRSQVDT